MFHLTKFCLNQVYYLWGDIMKQNPELMKQFAFWKFKGGGMDGGGMMGSGFRFL